MQIDAQMLIKILTNVIQLYINKIMVNLGLSQKCKDNLTLEKSINVTHHINTVDP